MFGIFKNLTQKKEDATKDDVKIVAKCPKCGKDIIDTGEYWACVDILSGTCNFKMKNTYKGEKMDISQLVSFEEMEQFEYIYSIIHKKAQNEKTKREGDKFRNHTKLGTLCNTCRHDMYKMDDKVICSNEKCGFEIGITYKGVAFSDKQMIELLNRRVSEEYTFNDGIKGRVLINQNKKHDFISEYLLFTDVKDLEKKYLSYYFLPESMSKMFESIEYLKKD